nr:DUF6436 domain-containing protein [Atopomonas sediminilitoris]
MLTAFLWFQQSYIRPFSDSNSHLDALQWHAPQALRGAGPIRVVHFWQPGCPCNVANQAHLNELRVKYREQPVQFFHVKHPSESGQLPGPLSDVLALEANAAFRPPVSPAVGIWDSQGRLAYFGPYSEGMVCNAANSFIEPLLDRLLTGERIQSSNTLAVGCFCRW